MSDSGADTVGTGVAVAVAAAVVSQTVAGEVAVVAGVGVVVVVAAAAAAVVVGEPVAVVGENLLRGRQRRVLFPGRLSMAAGFLEGLHPARSSIGVVLSTLPVGWRQTALYNTHHCWKYFVVTGGKGRAIPLQTWRGPEGSRRLRLPDFKTISTERW